MDIAEYQMNAMFLATNAIQEREKVHKLVHLLLTKGQADVNYMCNDQGGTALSFAILRKDPQLVQMLVF
jgi:hypothetical protein